MGHNDVMVHLSTQVIPLGVLSRYFPLGFSFRKTVEKIKRADYARVKTNNYQVVEKGKFCFPHFRLMLELRSAWIKEQCYKNSDGQC